MYMHSLSLGLVCLLKNLHLGQDTSFRFMGFDLFLWNRLENKIVNGKVLKMLYQNIVHILPFYTDYAPVQISAFSTLDNSNHLIYH